MNSKTLCSSQNEIKNRTPGPLTDTLLEFTMTYLLEQPENVLDFAMRHYEEIQNSRRTVIEHPVIKENDGTYSENYLSGHAEPQTRERRKSVSGESYRPESTTNFTKPVYQKTDLEMEVLKNAAKHVFLFKSLDEEQREDILKAMFRREVSLGEVIIRQGDDGDYFYTIESGIYNVYISKGGKEPEHVFTYNDRGCFGELALLYNQPRAATVVAESDGIIWALDRRTFQRIVVQAAFEKRQMYEKFTKTVPLLQSLGSYEKLNLCDVLIPRKYKAGEPIIKQGEEPDGMYFMETGTAVIKIKVRQGDEVEICRREPGSYFGELELVTAKRRIASVYAKEDVKAAFLEGDAFERLMGPCIDVMKRNINSYQKITMGIVGNI